ncbi:MAG: hypothetical protein U0736_15155 [Gemmataceae bacterium]
MITLLIGTYMLVFRRYEEVNDVVILFRVSLVIGGIIGLFVFRTPTSQDFSEGQPDQSTPANIATRAEPVRPAWMGDPEGKRRRLKVILSVLAVVALGLAIYAMLVSRQ